MKTRGKRSGAGERTMKPEEGAIEEPALALSACALSRLLALALSPPSAGTLPAIFSTDPPRGFLHAAATLDGGPPGSVHEAALDLARFRSLTLEDLRRLHQEIFGHTPKGRVCPCETEYGTEEIFQQANQMADIAGFYLAFGLEPSADQHERPDHIATELEFLGFLLMKEVHAAESGDAEMLDVTREARKRFLREHLGAFGRAFASALVKADPEGFFGAAGRLCSAFLESICLASGVPIGPAWLPLRPATTEGVPMACGPGPELLEIGRPGPR